MEKKVQSVRYIEAKPPNSLSGFVHCFWELKTVATLPEDFLLHALPDACVNVLFNQLDTDIAGITALRTAHEVLNLGKAFHYVGIQLWPGVWRGDRSEIVDRFVGTPYLGSLPLTETSARIEKSDFPSKQPILSELVHRFVDDKLVVASIVTRRILEKIDGIRTVADMATATNLSPRQLQRTLKQTTGFSPHDFLKILRVQMSFKRDYLMSYADQSHFIHSFRKITGYTPARYADKFAAVPWSSLSKYGTPRNPDT
jgi:AraC-like DNA-binding protein